MLMTIFSGGVVCVPKLVCLEFSALSCVYQHFMLLYMAVRKGFELFILLRNVCNDLGTTK